MSSQFQKALVVMLGLFALGARSAATAGLIFKTNDGAIVITGYAGNATDVVIPPATNGLQVTSIETNAFFERSTLTNAVIPGTVTNIGAGAFNECRFLSSVTIGDGVATIGDGAFMASGLTNVFIPSTVTNLGDIVFDACPDLREIIVDGQNPAYSSVGGVLFNKSQTTLLQYPSGGRDGNYAIPAGVINIGDHAFVLCTLKNIEVPDGVEDIGDFAFSGCLGLTNLTLPATVTNLGQGVFSTDFYLSGVYFKGDAPAIDTSGTNAFDLDYAPTVYYLPGAKDWSSMYADVPALMWNPTIQFADGGFGVSGNQFEFNVTGTSNIQVVVEATTNLPGGNWSPLETITLTNGMGQFSEALQANGGKRFYRLSAP